MANYGFMEKHPGIDLGELDIATALLLMQQTNGKEDAGESRGRHGKERKVVFRFIKWWKKDYIGHCSTI